MTPILAAVRVILRATGLVLSWLLVAPIRAYQLLVSPLLGPRCRFYPSCSAYAVEALTVRGPLVGLGLAAWRLLRCHPWNPGGPDPVPSSKARTAGTPEPQRSSGPLGSTQPSPRTSVSAEPDTRQGDLHRDARDDRVSAA